MGRKDIGQLLLDNGANLNATPSLHGSALMEAAESGNMGIMSLLLGHDASFSAQAYGLGSGDALHSVVAVGQSEAGMYSDALQAAAHYGDIGSVRALLDVGVNVNAQGGYHGNALQAAAGYGRLELAQI